MLIISAPSSIHRSCAISSINEKCSMNGGDLSFICPSSIHRAFFIKGSYSMTSMSKRGVGKMGRHSRYSWRVPMTGLVAVLTSAAPTVGMWEPENDRFQLRYPAPELRTILIKCKYHSVGWSKKKWITKLRLNPFFCRSGLVLPV